MEQLYAQNKNALISVFGLAFLIFIVLIPNSPLYTLVPTRDPGVFLYMGNEILEGETPYQDVWDHKPPLIYYINALGLWITGQSFWGVWILEIVSLSIAGFLGFILFQRIFGTMSATIGSLIWIVQLGQTLAFEGGNFTEEFALPLQFAALYLFWQMQKPGRLLYLHALFIGLCGGTAFLLKPNLIGLWVAIVAYLVLSGHYSRQKHTHLAVVGTIFLGAFSVIIGMIIFFYNAYALNSFWDAAFRYNFEYIGTTNGIIDRINAVILSIGLLLLSGIMFTAIGGWLLGIHTLVNNYLNHRRLTDHLVLVAIALIDFPIEGLLLSLSGRMYPHYVIPWLPSLAILTVFFIHGVRSRWRLGVSPKIHALLQICISLILAVMLCSVLFLFYSRTVVDDYEKSRTQLVDYIRANVVQDEYVLLWGAESQIHFITDRDAPSRYVYLYPLYTKEYQNAEMVNEFLNDIKRNQPVLIIDASFYTDKVPPISASRQATWTTTWYESYGELPEMAAIYWYIDACYEPIPSIPGFEGDVYRLHDYSVAPIECMASILLSAPFEGEMGVIEQAVPG